VYQTFASVKRGKNGKCERASKHQSKIENQANPDFGSHHFVGNHYFSVGSSAGLPEIKSKTFQNKVQGADQAELYGLHHFGKEKIARAKEAIVCIFECQAKTKEI